MASTNFPLIFLLVLASLSVAFGYSLSTRAAFSQQEDESFLVATNDQGSSMIVVEDLVKTRSLQALVDGSKVVVNEEVPKRRSTKSSKTKKPKSEKKKKKKKSKGKTVGTAVGIVAAAIVILCVIYLIHRRRKKQKAQKTAQGN
ncbi:unnamed protein product [Arabidopsis halleri]